VSEIVNDPDSLARIIRSRRKELSLTQAELADLSEVSARFIFDLEKAKPTIAMDKFQKVRKALGLRLLLEIRI
jgi:y4mF family transcriptional regulator